MGRELKRVPLDFSHPIGEIWPGYLNPHYEHCHECQECKGSGYSPQAHYLYQQWYGYVPFSPAQTGSTPITPDHPALRQWLQRLAKNDPHFYTPAVVESEARRLSEMWNGQWNHHLDELDVRALLDAGRLMDFTHTPRTEEQARPENKHPNGWLKESNGYTPTPQEVNDWHTLTMGHDSINCGVCVAAKAKRLGYPVHCSRCDGGGEWWDSPEHEAAAEAWQREDPPEGEGFQLWTTTNEGAPISPVFTTLDELCAWAEDGATVFGSEKASAQRWREMLDEGWVRHEEGNAVFM